MNHHPNPPPHHCLHQSSISMTTQCQHPWVLQHSVVHWCLQPRDCKWTNSGCWFCIQWLLFCIQWLSFLHTMAVLCAYDGCHSCTQLTYHSRNILLLLHYIPIKTGADQLVTSWECNQSVNCKKLTKTALNQFMSVQSSFLQSVNLLRLVSVSVFSNIDERPDWIRLPSTNHEGWLWPCQQMTTATQPKWQCRHSTLSSIYYYTTVRTLTFDPTHLLTVTVPQHHETMTTTTTWQPWHDAAMTQHHHEAAPPLRVPNATIQQMTTHVVIHHFY